MARTRVPGLQRTKSWRISRSRESLLQQGKLVSADYIVYFAKASQGVKIGYSGATRNRMADLTAEQGEAVRVLGMAFVPTSAVARKLEAKMHVLFREKWIRGEWFDLTMSDVMMALGMCRKIGIRTAGGEDNHLGGHMLSGLCYANQSAVA